MANPMSDKLTLNVASSRLEATFLISKRHLLRASQKAFGRTSIEITRKFCFFSREIAFSELLADTKRLVICWLVLYGC